jgi:copper chaperone CopZ
MLKVGGLHCEGCANTLKNALSSVEGVSEATIDFNNQKAIVVFDPVQTDEANLRKTIKDVGYIVR